MRRSRQVPRVKYRHWIFKFPFVGRYRGMVMGRTILFKDDETEIAPALLRHEFVHLEQMDRHGVARFYLIYFSDYLANFWRLRDHDAAYRHIQFEREACERSGENAPSRPEATNSMRPERAEGPLSEGRKRPVPAI
jgi:hypothetical protein